MQDVWSVDVSVGLEDSVDGNWLRSLVDTGKRIVKACKAKKKKKFIYFYFYIVSPRLNDSNALSIDSCLKFVLNFNIITFTTVIFNILAGAKTNGSRVQSILSDDL